MHEIFQFLQYLFSYLLTYFSKAKLAWQRWYLISMLLRFHEIFYNIFSSFGRLDFCSIFLIFVAFIELAKQWHTINMIFMKLCFHEFFFRSFGGLDFGCSNRIQILVLKHHERSFSRILFFLTSFYELSWNQRCIRMFLQKKNSTQCVQQSKSELCYIYLQYQIKPNTVFPRIVSA